MANESGARDEWDVQGASHKCSTVISVKQNLMMNIRYQVGSGKKILFWHDT